MLNELPSIIPNKTPYKPPDNPMGTTPAVQHIRIPRGTQPSNGLQKRRNGWPGDPNILTPQRPVNGLPRDMTTHSPAPDIYFRLHLFLILALSLSLRPVNTVSQLSEPLTLPKHGYAAEPNATTRHGRKQMLKLSARLIHLVCPARCLTFGRAQFITAPIYARDVTVPAVHSPRLREKGVAG